jgi:hypothetical protein
MLNEVDLERGTTVWIIMTGGKAVGTCRGLMGVPVVRSLALDSRIIDVSLLSVSGSFPRCNHNKNNKDQAMWTESHYLKSIW